MKCECGRTKEFIGGVLMCPFGSCEHESEPKEERYNCETCKDTGQYPTGEMIHDPVSGPEMEMANCDCEPKPVNTELFCTWEKVDDDCNGYESGCGQLFTFFEGGIKDNKFRYCYHCGKQVKELGGEE